MRTETPNLCAVCLSALRPAMADAVNHPARRAISLHVSALILRVLAADMLPAPCHCVRRHGRRTDKPNGDNPTTAETAAHRHGTSA